MKLNFKYYNTGSLIVLILVLSVIFIILKEIFNSFIEIPTGLLERLKTLNDYLGWISPVAFISIILVLINERLWKYKFMQWLIDIPNLNGRYEGKLISSYKDDLGEYIKKECIIEIKQNASSIHIYSYYADENSDIQTSMSFSIAEEIIKENNGSYKIYYLFSNEPDSMIEALNKHNGTAKFTFLEDKRELKGEYYNHRQNKGTINVKFVGNKLFHRLKK